MRAVVCQGQQLDVSELPDPVPGKGQVLLEVLRCGICGSDLHARRHSDDVADLATEIGYDDFMRSGDGVVMGHEFCGEVLDYGPGTKRTWRPGTRVVSLPLVRRGGEVHLTGLSAKAPGGYAERVLVEASLSMEVPNGLPTDVAATTEPLSVAWHAVRKGEVGRRQTAVVIGCGPIGLAVICMLKARGVRTVVASDFSAARRALAERCGADVVVDPASESPWTSYDQGKQVTTAPQLLELAVGTTEKLRSVPLLPWWHVFRVAQTVGASPSGPVVFECVGVPGILDSVISSAPLLSRVVVVGVCMEPDRIRPAMAINKEIELRFAFGYDPGEFHDTLRMLADGKVDPSPMLTGTVGLAGVSAAFDALGDPEAHAKILVDPSSAATTPDPVR